MAYTPTTRKRQIRHQKNVRVTRRSNAGDYRQDAPRTTLKFPRVVMTQDLLLPHASGLPPQTASTWPTLGTCSSLSSVVASIVQVLVFAEACGRCCAPASAQSSLHRRLQSSSTPSLPSFCAALAAQVVSHTYNSSIQLFQAA